MRDLARTEAWYEHTLDYRRAAEFVEDDVLMGIAMVHNAGGPELAFRLDPARAEAAAGFDHFSIDVPDQASLDALAARLDSLGEPADQVCIGVDFTVMHLRLGHRSHSSTPRGNRRPD